MNLVSLWEKPVRYTFVLVGLAILCGDLAVAEPPPPSFWGFTISNNIPDTDVTNINVKLYPGVKGASPETSYHTLGMPYVYAISSLPSGGYTVINMPNTWCIAKIEVTAKCSGALKTSPLEITANQSNYEMSDPDLEYAGFTCKYDDFTTVPMTLTFALVNGQPNAKLSALSRWDTDRMTKTANSDFN